MKGHRVGTAPLGQRQPKSSMYSSIKSKISQLLNARWGWRIIKVLTRV